MKKSMYILLTIIMLLLVLTGCEHFAPGGGQVERPPLTPADDPADEPEDPTVDEYGFTLFPEGNYLADPMFDTDEYLPDYDVDLAFLEYGSSWDSAICSTEDTIFSFTCYASDTDHLLRYTDKATGLTLPLCGKPECTHDNINCNAWVGRQAYGFRLYDGKLMWVDEEAGMWYLMRMNRDGTEREKLTYLNLKGNQLGSNKEFFMHRGYIYFLWENMNLVENGEPAHGLYIYAQPIDGGESFAILDLVQVGKNTIPHVWAVPAGNDIYIVLSWTEYPEEDSGARRKTVQLYRWSSETRKAEQLCSAADLPWDISPEGGYPRVAPGDGIYFVTGTKKDDPEHPIYAVGSRGEQGWIMEYTLIRYAFDNGEFEEISTFSLPNGSGVVMLAEENIFLYGPMYAEENCMRGYDYEGKPVFQSGPLMMPDESSEEDSRSYCYFQMLAEDGEYIYYMFVNFDPPVNYHQPGKDLCVFAAPLDGGEILNLSVDSRTRD